MECSHDMDIGLGLIEVLNLKLKPNGRVDTSWGDKTPVGLSKVVNRILRRGWKMMCMACSKDFGHYCSSCDPIINYDEGFCDKCWELTGARDIYYEYDKKIDALYVERDEKLKTLAESLKNVEVNK